MDHEYTPIRSKRNRIFVSNWRNVFHPGGVRVRGRAWMIYKCTVTTKDKRTSRTETCRARYPAALLGVPMWKVLDAPWIHRGSTEEGSRIGSRFVALSMTSAGGE